MLNTRSLTKVAYAPGDLYSQAVPFEVAMEHIRGLDRIDLNNTDNPDSDSFGFADESGYIRRVSKSLLAGR